MGGKDSEGQLVSFFLYSFVVYPVANYLLSPQRQYNRQHGRWRGIFYTIMFLALITGGQMFMEHLEEGPNFYQSLRATRHTTPAELKVLYKKRMLETHPDKNKSPTAVDDFRRAKLANEVLSNAELRDIYDRLGEHGLRVFAQEQGDDGSGVRGVDTSFVLVQMLMWAGSCLVMAFVMTLSEPSGEAFAHSVWGVLMVLLLELIYVVSARPLPAALLPTWSPHDLLTALRRLYPAAMNASRCICSALHEDPFLFRVEVLDRLVAASSAVSQEALKVAFAWQDRVKSVERDVSGAGGVSRPPVVVSPVEALVGQLKGGAGSSARMQRLADRVASLDKRHCATGAMRLQEGGGGRVGAEAAPGEGGVASLFSLPHLAVYVALQAAYSYFYA
mmetsp:Transcript_14835/g.24556  ORF Transcript_14835/g.24556 Transcript_14835/m.24556 type:complete len:389 (-) Transcript_14835:190-1356(-)